MKKSAIKEPYDKCLRTEELPQSCGIMARSNSPDMGLKEGLPKQVPAPKDKGYVGNW